MTDSPCRPTPLERIIESISNIVTTGAFLAMIWLAVHIVQNPNGPREINRYFENHFTNFVDPTVSATVTQDKDGLYRYGYTVSNSFWALQDIFEIAIGPRTRRNDTPHSDWHWTYVPVSPLRRGTGWVVTDRKAPGGGIGRGESLGKFVVTSSAPPTIIQAWAANKFYYYWGISTDITTPAGKRIIRWTVGPGRSTEKPSQVIEQLIPLISRSTELGWIHERSIADSIANELRAALNEIRLGNRDRARALLRLVSGLNASNSENMSSEAAALIALNIDYAASKLE